MKKILAILLAMLMITAMTVAMASGDTGVSGGTTFCVYSTFICEES